MPKKIFLFLFTSFLLSYPLSASFYYIKLGTTTPPIYQHGSLPSAGVGARLKCGFIDLDLSVLGASKKKSSYIAAKSLLLFFTGSQIYFGAGAGLAFGDKTSIIKLIREKNKTKIINFEAVIGYEYANRFAQIEFSKPFKQKSLNLSNSENWGIALMFGFCL